MEEIYRGFGEKLGGLEKSGKTVEKKNSMLKYRTPEEQNSNLSRKHKLEKYLLFAAGMTAMHCYAQSIQALCWDSDS